nr:hypothetical protein [Streptomyces sp. DSM 41633]
MSSAEIGKTVVDLRQIAGLSAADRRHLGELLDTANGAELLTTIDDDLAARVLKAIPVPAGAGLLNELDAPQAAEILRRLGDSRRDSLLGAMAIDRAQVLRTVLSWPEDSVAAHM